MGVVGAGLGHHLKWREEELDLQLKHMKGQKILLDAMVMAAKNRLPMNSKFMEEEMSKVPFFLSAFKEISKKYTVF